MNPLFSVYLEGRIRWNQTFAAVFFPVILGIERFIEKIVGTASETVTEKAKFSLPAQKALFNGTKRIALKEVGAL